MMLRATCAAVFLTLFSASAWAVESAAYIARLKQLVQPGQCIYSVDSMPKWFGDDEWRTVIADTEGRVVDIVTQSVTVSTPVYNLPVYVAANAGVPLCANEPITTSMRDDLLLPLDD